MSHPDRIHINWNASDGFSRFRANGYEPIQSSPPDPDMIMTVLSKEKGRLFRLLGWFGDPPVELWLMIVDHDEQGLHIRNYQPSFEAVMIVADEPPPYVTMHGDYLFDLVPAPPNDL